MEMATYKKQKEMSGTKLVADRFVKIINQQLEVLKEEKNAVNEALDHCVKQVQSEVDAWFNGGDINQKSCVELSNRIQQATTVFIEKSFELSAQEVFLNKSDIKLQSLTTTMNLETLDAKKTRDETISKSETIAAQFTTMKISILEDTVLSLKETLQQVQEKQENVDRTLKDLASEKEHFNKKVETLTHSNLKSKKQIKQRLVDIEMASQDNSANIDQLYETTANLGAKLNILEDENKSINASMNELNKENSSLKSRSYDVIMNIQDLSKKVTSYNDQYDEMSAKMNELETSLNLLSSIIKDPFQNVSSMKIKSLEDSIGMVCQLLDERLAPLENLREILNKRISTTQNNLSKIDALEIRIAALSNSQTQIHKKYFAPLVGFYASTELFCTAECNYVRKFEEVEDNYGNHFDPSTGTFTAPIDGLYLISVTSGTSGARELYCTRCYLKRNFARSHSIDDKNLFDIHASQTITRCIVMKAGDAIYLQSMAYHKNMEIWFSINFSCCLIK